MTFTIPYPPSSNRYWRHCKGMTFVSPEARAYRRRAAILALAAGVRSLAGPVIVHIDVYRPQKSGDLDNTLKVLLDSLKGIAFEDDKQIVEIVARRFDDKARPRAEVTVGVSELAGTQKAMFAEAK